MAYSNLIPKKQDKPLTLQLTLAFVILAVVAVVTLSALDKSRRRKTEKKLGCEPAPKSCAKWPFALDLVFEAFRALPDDRVLSYFHGIYVKSGNTFVTDVLGERIFNTMDPVNVEAILSKQFNEFVLGHRLVTLGPLLGSGIFTLDGEGWRQSRELLRPQFSQKNLRGFKQIDVEINHLIDRIRETADSDPSRRVDLAPLFQRLTLNTTTYMLFGHSINSLEEMHPNDFPSRFAEAFQYSQKVIAERDNLGYFYWLHNGPKFRKACREVHAYLDSEVGKVLDHADPEKEAGEFSVLSALLQHTRDPKVLREQLVNVLLAGRDTTASTLTWTFFLLVRHPQVLARLRQEVRDASVLEESDELPQMMAMFREMPYLNCVIKEVTRVLPIVPVNARRANCETTIPAGGGPDGKSPVFVRKGEVVSYSVFSMHRRQDIYGPDSLEFRPERWEVPEGEPWCLNKIGWAFAPFNGGPRVCLGRELAILSAGLTIARIIRAFPSISLPDGEEVVPTGQEKHDLALVLSSKDGCKVIIGESS